MNDILVISGFIISGIIYYSIFSFYKCREESLYKNKIKMIDKFYKD